MLKRCLLSIEIAVLLLLTAGCWDRTEITDLAISLASGVDALPNGKIKATAQLILPTGIGEETAEGQKKKSSLPFWTESASGADMRETIGFLQEKLSRKLYVAQRRILVIGEDLARRGLQPVLDHFSRDPRSRLRTYVLVAKAGTASDILKASYLLEKEPAVALGKMEDAEIGKKTDLKAIHQSLLSGQAFTVPTIQLVSRTDERDKTFRLTGSAVFREDKLIGYLDEGNTRGLMWLTKETKNAIITVHPPDLDGYISSIVIRSKTKFQVKKEGKQIVIHAAIRADEDVMENTTALDLTQPRNVDFVEKITGDELLERIQAALKEIQISYKADVIGFGKMIDRTYPEVWKAMRDSWDYEQFPKLKVVIDAKINIQGIGVSGPSLSLRKKKSMPELEQEPGEP